MARRRSSGDEDISLFPFLSIIACVIGVLTMMIATMVLAQTDTPDVAQVEAYQELQRRLDDTENQIETVQQEIAVSKSATLKVREQRQTLEITVSELEALLEELAKVEAELEEQQKVEITIPPVDAKLRETLADMQAQAEALEEQVAQLEAELDQEQARAEGQVTVLPQGSGLNFIPHFIECAADSVVLHMMDPPKRIRRANLMKDDDFLAMLETVANGTNDSIVFLLRSDGLATYRQCKSLCDPREIRNGKIPVVGKGRIDLSAFTKLQERD